MIHWIMYLPIVHYPTRKRVLMIMRFKAKIEMFVSFDADSMKDAADRLEKSDLVNEHPTGMVNEYCFIRRIQAVNE